MVTKEPSVGPVAMNIRNKKTGWPSTISLGGPNVHAVRRNESLIVAGTFGQ